MADKAQVAYYDNLVPHFQAQRDNPRNVSFRNLLDRWINPAKASKVLDFGCALGYHGGPFSERGMKVVGVDLSPKCIEIARRDYPKATWYAGDMVGGEFKIAEKDFDWVIMSDVIEHVPKKLHARMFKIIGNMTKPYGAVIASWPNPEKHEEAKAMGQPVEEEVHPFELLARVRSGGFERVVSLYLDGIYYRAVIQKVGGI